MLPVLFGLGVSERRLSLARLAQVTSENPARAFGLWPQKGRVGIGADADLVLWDPAATQRLGAAGEHSRAGYSLYEGLEVRGRINAVLVRGQIVVRDGLRVGDAVAGGRFLPTGPFDPLADDAARAAASAEPLVRR
jgi:dihydropyrimidinase